MLKLPILASIVICSFIPFILSLNHHADPCCIFPTAELSLKHPITDAIMALSDGLREYNITLPSFFSFSSAFKKSESFQKPGHNYLCSHNLCQLRFFHTSKYYYPACTQMKLALSSHVYCIRLLQKIMNAVLYFKTSSGVTHPPESFFEKISSILSSDAGAYMTNGRAWSESRHPIDEKSPFFFESASFRDLKLSILISAAADSFFFLFRKICLFYIHCLIRSHCRNNLCFKSRIFCNQFMVFWLSAGSSVEQISFTFDCLIMPLTLMSLSASLLM